MKIDNHKLIATDGEATVNSYNSPNKGGTLAAQYLVIHYTAGRSANSSINWLMNPDAKASAHIVIGVDGSITQLVPFNKVAWHAGPSMWDGLVGMNNHSIGIELDNPGMLKKIGNSWMAWFGREYPSSLVLETNHKHSTDIAGWHIFSELQLEACIKVSQLLVSRYNLKDILGHDDVSPGRKVDPGPAFPIDAFKARILGRKENEASHFVNTDMANLREGPGMTFNVITALPKETKAEVIRRHMNWSFVYVHSPVAALPEKEGWIHNSLLSIVSS